jgi:hypothetical protein
LSNNGGEIDTEMLLTKTINELSILANEKEDILQSSAEIVREKDKLSERRRLEIEELKREVNRFKFQGRVNGHFAFDKITSDDVWSFIVRFI